MIQDLTNKRVTVFGLGRFGGGVGATRWLAGQGARVTVTDNASEERLRESLDQIADLDVTLRMGEHREEDFREAELIVVNPAVPDASEFLQVARDAGVPITTEINLFVERCPAQVVGITGSVGKSTVTAMIGHVLERGLADRRVLVGGNLGRSLLDSLEQIRPTDVVVLELSSFQLQRTPLVGWSPSIAVITNISPNHLDWHGTYEAYAAAKMNIFRFQSGGSDALVVGASEELARFIRSPGAGSARICEYGLDGDTPVTRCQTPNHPEKDAPKLRWENLELAIPGRHNRENAAAALTVAHLIGIDSAVAVDALASFAGLPHRLKLVAEVDGVRYYDDSKSTTPEATITAINAFHCPLSVILGGYDKGIDLTPAAHLAASRARFVACLGQTGPVLCGSVRAAGGEADLFDSLAGAVRACRGRAHPGDVVLLSPGCASWDMFPDYRVRGEEFAKICRG